MPRILFKFFKNDRYFFLTTTVCFLQFFFLNLLFLFFYSKLPSKLPLLYSLSWGDGQLISKNQFLIIPAVMVLIILINLGLASQLHYSQTFLKRVLFIANTLITTILFISALKIMVVFI
ncbi:MAG: hypothetical protein HYW45_01720 [Candidatus Daviesbacteria bacterium]|nr:MAG: hypothetical protein HYW45_01720 [Candidatus Daviesbacteria bacterium]